LSESDDPDVIPDSGVVGIGFKKCLEKWLAAIQKSRGLSEVMRYRKPDSAIDYRAVEISRPVAGAHKHSKKREYITTWVKDGIKFEHYYPEDVVIRNI